jgi:glycosyltransferase involved in cell wall biosynthesis
MKKLLRIANITEDGRLGGPRARIAAVAERFKSYNVETTVICPRYESDQFCNKLKESGIKVKRLHLHHLTRDKAHMAHFLAFFFVELYGLLRYLRQVRFDVVHCNGAYQFKGIIAGKLAGAKVIWHLNDTRRQKIVHSCFRVLSPLFCDGFIFAGRRVQTYYACDSAILGKPFTEIQAPVNTQYFSPDFVPLEPELETDHPLTILTVSNLNPAKGLEYFIEMTILLNNLFSGLKFIIVGNYFGSQKRYYEKLAELRRFNKIENLYFTQGVEDVRPYLKNADIYVCSSIHEASPMSVWEAMAMAKPIVSTNVGDVSRYIKNGEDGFIVPPRDAGALAEKIEILIKSKHLRKQFSARVRKTAVKKLDIDVCTSKHVEAYKKVLQL